MDVLSLSVTSCRTFDDMSRYRRCGPATWKQIDRAKNKINCQRTRRRTCFKVSQRNKFPTSRSINAIERALYQLGFLFCCQASESSNRDTWFVNVDTIKYSNSRDHFTWFNSVALSFQNLSSIWKPIFLQICIIPKSHCRPIPKSFPVFKTPWNQLNIPRYTITVTDWHETFQNLWTGSRTRHRIILHLDFLSRWPESWMEHLTRRFCRTRD